MKDKTTRRTKLTFSNKNYDVWFENFKEYFGIKNDRAFCEMFGLSYSSISGYKRNNSFPYQLIVDYCLEENVPLEKIFNKTPLNRQKPNASTALKVASLFELDTINEDMNMQLPEVHNNNNATLKYFYQNKNAFVIDTSIENIVREDYYLMHKEGLYFIVYIMINIDGTFKATRVDSKTLSFDESQSIVIEKISEYDILGLVVEAIRLEKLF